MHLEVCLDPHVLPITAEPVHGTIESGSLSISSPVPPGLPIDVDAIAPVTQFYGTSSLASPGLQQLGIEVERLIKTLLHRVNQP